MPKVVFTRKKREMKKRLLKKRNQTKLNRVFTALCMLLFITVLNSDAQTYLPSSYWTFNNPSAINRDSMNNVNLDFSTYNCQYTVVGGVSGKSIELDNNVSIINAGSFTPDTGFTIEFWFRPGYKFNQCYLFQRLDGAISAFFSYPNLKFKTSTKTSGGQVINDELSIDLNQLGRKSYDYYMDGNWHHMVFKYTGSTGKKEVWVDGELPSGFSKSITAGNVNNPTSSNKTLIFEHTVSYVKFYGAYDEIAIYKSPIPSKMIYNHYQQGLAGQSYSFNVPNITVPTASPTSGPIDILEYAPGHPNVSVTAISQLSQFPLPRYKTGHGLLPNFNWMNPQYFGGLSQPGVSTSQAISNSSTIILELAKNWNYYLTVNDNTTSCWNYNNLNTFQGAWVKLANDNPQYPAAAISFWAQTRPSDIGRPSSTPYIWAKNLANSFYLRNSSGQYLDINGNVTSNKIWSPSSSMDSVYWDGRTQKMYLEKLVQKLTRPLDIINENAEVIPLITQNGLQADPAVVSDKNASGLNWIKYQGDRKARFSKHYRDQFMNTIPQLANTKFTEYAIDGQPTWRHDYSESRSINSTINGQYYATPDFYPRWPHNWRYWSSAWHGWQWIVESRVNELAVGDKLYSPFVSAGWDNNEENNMRPAQWLGLLKALGVTGAEFYYTGFFNLAAPFPKPQDYAWQSVMPAYSQAVTSRYEDILRNGDLMTGDVPNSYSNPSGPGYSFWAGDMSKLVVARKHSSLDKYVISGTIQPINNMAGSTQSNDVASVTINGNNLKFNIRRQGSTFIYDRTTPSDPVFYQLDGWHENTHPYYWSKDFEIEAELFDNNNTSVKLKTKLPSGSTQGDYTNYTTYVTYPNTQSTTTVLEYTITPRTSQQATLYLWVRAKSKTGNATGLSVAMDASASKSIGCISDTAWTWYRYDACTQQAISYSGLSLNTHTLKFTASSTDLELDKFILTTNANLGLNNNPPVCSASTATITANGSTTLCQGQTVQLTASAGTSYLWSNGATTASITTGNSGNYMVTVGSGSGCSAVSNPVNVSVSNSTATITANGPTSFCQGSQVQLTANNGSSYLWSNGQTTKNITVTGSGSFSVQVTQSGGCTATSNSTNVIVYNNPNATIVASGPTTFCSGSSVALMASGGNSYIWSNGATGSSINVTSSGIYSVTATNVNGCSDLSNSINVTVNNGVNPTISASGSTSNICPGTSVTLSATAGQSYTWSSGETTQSIQVSSAGIYSVNVSNSSGCSGSSNTIQVTYSTLPNAQISPAGNTTFCQGGSVSLNTNTAQSYLWSDGSTTSSILVNSSGNYTVMLTNSNGCTQMSSPVQVNVLANPVATITNTTATTFCQGGNVILTANGGNTYNWSNGETTNSIMVSSSGNYSVMATASNGCTASSNLIPVTVYSLPVATITPSGNLNITNGQTVTLNASPGSSYYWIPGGQTTQSITVSAAGTYQVMVISATNCVNYSTPVQITVSSQVSITTNGSSSICDGTPLTLTANGSGNFVWTNGETTQSIVVTQGGTYGVSLLDNSGNILSTDQIVVTATPSPDRPTIQLSYIPNTAYQLEAYEPTAHSYVWSNGETNSSILTNSTGNFSVKAVNAYGCLSDEAQMTVNTIQNLGCTQANMLSAYNILDTSAILSWNPAITADYFKVIAQNTNSSQQIIQNVPGYLSKVQINGLTPGATYDWHVVSYCGNNVLFSAVHSVTTRNGNLVCGSTPQNTQAVNIMAQEVTLKWYSTDAVQFRVRYRVIGQTGYDHRYFSGIEAMTGTMLKGLTHGTTYEWGVQALCDGIWSLYSEKKYFTTHDACLMMFNPYTSHINDVSARVNWQQLVNVDSVRVRFWKTGFNSDVRFKKSVTSLNGINCTLLDLEPNTTYTYQLMSFCPWGRSDYGDTLQFTTTNIAQLSGNSEDLLQLNSYPNPATDKLTYAFDNPEDGEYKVMICDMAGKILFSELRVAQEGATSAEIHVDPFARGLYVLVLQKKAMTSRFKFSLN